MLLVAGCAATESSPDGLPEIAVTTGLWADVVSNVACDGLAIIEAVVPPGANPHGFEPSLADRGRMEAADVVVANGLGLEQGLDDVLAAVEGNGTPVVRVAELVRNPLADGEDPHVWFDPVRVADALPTLAAKLVEATDLNATALEACVTAYQAELTDLDSEIADLVSTIPPEARRLVTNHDSLGYFADRYGFDVIGTVIPTSSGLAQASPVALESLADLISATGVPAIFAEEAESADDINALADRVGGVDVVTLLTGSLGDSGSGADTYVGLLRVTAERIVGALG